jgi:hypothetical protein
MRIHAPGDQIVGAPICEDCYDWESAVVWQWWAPELWRRTTIAIRRRLARALGVTETKRRPTTKRPIPPPCLADVASLEFAKVGEYQERGLIHFHALIRLDGHQGPGSEAPLDGATLSELVQRATHGVEFSVPGVDDDDRTRTLPWGQQLDVRVVRQGNRTDDPAGPLSPEQVAGYLAKYSTKDANSIRTGQPRPHLVRLRATVNDLAARARVQAQREDVHDDKPYALLGKWAHMYGFRGHFGSKSRRYSVTLGQLRRARRRYARMIGQGEDPTALDVRDLEARLLAQDDDETTLVIGAWTYQGSGWPRPGDAALALAAAARAREYEQWRATQRMTA